MGPNVADLLSAAALAEPEKIALSEAATGRTITWSALDELADRVAHGLNAAGMVAGYRVMLAVTNRIEFVASYFGVLRARMVVVPATPVAFAQGRAPELWLIPAGGKPISVGMIARDKPTTLALDPALLARLGPTAALAVSVEPLGGSPTGQPTGAVVAKGAISVAPDGGSKVAMTGDGRADQARGRSSQA